jgi:hypothetical protein
VGYFPFIPGVRDDRGADNITRLLMEQGRIAGDRTQQQGAIWGNAVAGLGQQVGGAIQQQQEAKQLAKRDAAAAAAFASWDGKDPKALLGSLKMFDPVTAMKLTEGAAAIAQISERADEQDLKRLQVGAQFIANLPDPLLEQYGPGFVKVAAPILSKFAGIPIEQFDQPADVPTLRQLAQALSGQTQKQPEPFTLSEGQTRFGPDGQPIANVPKPVEPPKPAQPRVVGRSLVDDSGKVIYRDPEPPRDEPLYQADVN